MKAQSGTSAHQTQSLCDSGSETPQQILPQRLHKVPVEYTEGRTEPRTVSRIESSGSFKVVWLCSQVGAVPRAGRYGSKSIPRYYFLGRR